MSPPAVKGRLAATKAAGILVSALRARKATNVVASGMPSSTPGPP
jgi:hypothetical protein